MSRSFQSVAVIVNGSEHTLDNGPFWYLGDTGFGMPELHRLTQRGAMQHGDSDLGYRLDPRVVGLAIGIEADSPADLWSKRRMLLSWFAPYNAPTLKLVLASGETFCLDCHAIGNLLMPSEDRIVTIQRVGIDLKASAPTFYDPVARTLDFSLGGGGDLFEVPTPVPSGIGASSIDQSAPITYMGTWRDQPRIRIVGPITDCIIENTSTDEKLDFTGVTIGDGDYYDIDTRFGKKSVVDSAGDNKLADLTEDSDLATFHLAPDSAAVPGGTNSIRVRGSAINSDTQIIMTYFHRYLGI